VIPSVLYHATFRKHLHHLITSIRGCIARVVMIIRSCQPPLLCNSKPETKQVLKRISVRDISAIPTSDSSLILTSLSLTSMLHIEHHTYLPRLFTAGKYFYFSWQITWFHTESSTQSVVHDIAFIIL
jgi:hypothetical protein